MRDDYHLAITYRTDDGEKREEKEVGNINSLFFSDLLAIVQPARRRLSFSDSTLYNKKNVLNERDETNAHLNEK